MAAIWHQLTTLKHRLALACRTGLLGLDPTALGFSVALLGLGRFDLSGDFAQPAHDFAALAFGEVGLEAGVQI